ncbi:MAG: lysylphosphatidylglycerol synthase transmembrane domain-containing protein [Candidatus Acidiferrales bacterium]
MASASDRTFYGGISAIGSSALISLFQPAAQEDTRVPRILGYGLALLCLIWVLHDFHIVRALRDFARVSWRWVLIGMAFDVLSYIMQAIRWRYLLAPFGKVRLTRSVRAIFSGLFANLIFPLRPGELLRSYVLSDSEGISFGLVLGSVGVERLVDLVIATASLGVVSLLVDLPRQFRRVADILGVATLVLLTIVVIAIFYLELKVGTSAKIESKARSAPGKVMSALVALHAMGTAPSFYPALLFSVLMPFCQVVGLWCMMIAYGLHLSFLVGVVVLVVINLGVSLPNAPANVGSYQFFCVLGLSVFEIEKTTAAGFSIFAFLALNLPFVFLGFAALVRSGMTFRSMRERVSNLPSELPGAGAPL